MKTALEIISIVLPSGLAFMIAIMTLVLREN